MRKMVRDTIIPHIDFDLDQKIKEEEEIRERLTLSIRATNPKMLKIHWELQKSDCN